MKYHVPAGTKCVRLRPKHEPEQFGKYIREKFKTTRAVEYTAADTEIFEAMPIMFGNKRRKIYRFALPPKALPWVLFEVAGDSVYEIADTIHG